MNGKGWKIVIDNGTRYVLPIDDIKTHEMNTTCACLPDISFSENGDMVVIHMAFDERHLHE